MEISVNTQAMMDMAEKARILKGELHNEYQQIELLVLSVGTDWQGDAERAFASKIIYLKKHFEKLESFFEELSEFFEKISEQYEEVENAVINELNQI